MIAGRVLVSGEAVVTVVVRGPGGRTARVEAMVDTGFNEQLTLPPWVVERLGLTFEEEAYYTLADGARSGTRVFRGEIEWHGTWREIMIVEIESDALLGMGAMCGCNLNIDVMHGGHVEIRPLAVEGIRD